MSALREAFVDYFAVRRALGFKLTKTEMTLRRFVEFAEEQGASHITTELALRWAQMPRHGDPSYCASRLRMVRLFARHCSTLDSRTEVPPEGLLPHRPRRKAPYLYSDTEIVRLVEAARRLPSPTGLRAATQSTLLGLLAVTGMRRSEPIALDREDVDLAPLGGYPPHREHQLGRIGTSFSFGSATATKWAKRRGVLVGGSSKARH